MNKFIAPLLICSLFACSDDDGGASEILAPATYTFSRDGESTVHFSGQTARIQMAEELAQQLINFNTTAEQLSDMFANENDPFTASELNSSSKSIKSKTAASADYFAMNTAISATIRAEFDSWIDRQVSEVFPAQQTLATAGVAGQLADGSSTRYVSAKGLEYNQLFTKSLIGALMVDQMLNNYLSTAVLDAGTNRENNTNGILSDDSPYTVMEHKWDEAYGYLYGTSADPANPNETIGEDDSFLNKYMGRVENDADFTGIAATVFDAFKLGRAAIVAGDYALRDEQAAIIREKISTIIGIRAVYYLQQGKNALTGEVADYGAAFHDLSEGYGFVYNLQFTRRPGTDQPYFSREEVQAFLGQLTSANGLWDLSGTTLDDLSSQIADRFDFSLEQAAN